MVDLCVLCSGLPGKMGDMGVPGSRGVPGKDGRPGEPGMKGDMGMDGIDGRRGLPGKNVSYILSMYRIIKNIMYRRIWCVYCSRLLVCKS